MFGLGAAVAFVVTGATVRRAAPYRTAGISHPERPPLELVALEHDRDGDRFIVRGMVRNPATAAVDGLVVAVSVFDRDGDLIGSGDAAVEASRLAAGAETPFVVIVSGAGDVERYHLSFARGWRHHAAPRPTGARCAGRDVMKTVTTAPRLVLAAAALVLAMAAVRAQNAEPQGDGGVRFKSGVELVNVTATVSDSMGRFVPGLQRDDFLVYEDNNPVEIVEFSAERVPVSLGIVLDTSGSMAGQKMEEARAALTRFTEELLDRANELFLYRFSNFPGLAQGWTNDRRRILYALDRMTPYGGTAMLRRRGGRDSPRAAGPEPQAGARRDLGRQRYGQPRGHPRPQAADPRERGPPVYAVGIDGEGEPTMRRGPVQPQPRIPMPIPFPFPGMPRGRSSWPQPPPIGGSGGNQRYRRLDDHVNAAALREMTDDSGGRTRSSATRGISIRRRPASPTS